MLRLQDARKAKNLTQQEVADAIGITRISYARYEGGLREPDLSTLVNLANLYEVTTDYLLGRTDDPFIVHSNDANSVDLVIDVPANEAPKPVADIEMKMPGTPEELAAFVKQIMQTATVGGNGKE